MYCRLKALSRPVQYVVYSGVSHAFFSFEQMVPEAKNANKLAADWMLKIFNDKEQTTHL
jgi:acetyl esterase/lipase